MRRRIEAMTLRAQHDVGVHPLAPQIEEAVGETHVLRDTRPRLLTGNGSGSASDWTSMLGDDELDLAGVELGIDRVGRAGDDRARSS